LEVYADKYDNAGTDYERAKVINYAINHLYCNIQPNLRIDLLADSQADRPSWRFAMRKTFDPAMLTHFTGTERYYRISRRHSRTDGTEVLGGGGRSAIG
jgi:hypothetical protein